METTKNILRAKKRKLITKQKIRKTKTRIISIPPTLKRHNTKYNIKLLARAGIAQTKDLPCILTLNNDNLENDFYVKGTKTVRRRN